MWICFYLFILCRIHDSLSQCPTEYSYNTENNISVTWKSESNKVVTTLCLNENNTLIQRNCYNSKWFPKNTPKCNKLQKEFLLKCDKGDREAGDFCIHHNPSNTFPFDKSIESINDTLRIAKLFENVSEMWLPVQRREKYNKFVWLKPYAKEKNKIYEHPLLINSNKEINTYKYECIVATNITVYNKSENRFDVEYVPKIVSCSIHYPTIYVYKKVNRYFISNQITKKYGSPLYYSNTGTKAFYIHEKCEKIAEPRYIEDNFLIKHLVQTQNKTCRIGIKYARNVGNFVWESTNEVINYTDWILSTQFDFNKVVISENGWSLNDSQFISCYVCEIDRRNYVTDLILEANKDNLILTAYSYDMLFYSIFCQVDGLEDFQYEFDFKSVKVHNEKNNSISTFNKRTVWKLVIKYEKPIELNHFHCSGSLFPHGDDDTTTKKVFFGRNIYTEFAFEVTFRNHCMHHICDPYLNKNFTKTLPEILSKKDIIKNIRAMRILKIYEINGDIELLYHAQIDKKININSAYDQLRKELEKNNIGSSISVNLDSLKSCQGCLPDKILVGNVSLHWDFTEIGATAINENCLQSNYLPITRMCTGNFQFGGKWMHVSGSCDNNKSVTMITKKLRNLRSNINTLPVTNISNALANLTRGSTSWNPYDVILISDIFKNLTSNVSKADDSKIDKIAKNVSASISNLVATNIKSLKLLKGLNTTNEILTSTESFMENIGNRNLNKSGVFQQIESNFIFNLFDPLSENITGIALIRPITTNKNPPFTDYTTKLLKANLNIEEISEIDNLEAAAFIPSTLLNEIIKENVSFKISMMFYYNDSLFVQSKKNNEKVSTIIFSISLPGYKNKTLYSSVPVIFRNFHAEKTNKFNCAFWGFEVNGGVWNNDAPSKGKYMPEKNIQVCKFNHLTHFALLLGIHATPTDPILAAAYKLSEKALNYLTGIGCILSIFGIFAIFITAVVFKNLRKMPGTKIILNVSICLLMQIILLYGNVKISSTACIVTAAVLHYSVLSGFMWSLIMAYLQYWKFAKVLGSSTSHLILKAFFVGWIAPMIPVAIVHIIINSTGENMTNMSQQIYSDFICYPVGIVLYTTVYLPVGIIVVINLIVFCMIIYQVHTQTKLMSTFRYNYDKRDIMIKEVKLSVFLFFALSLPWIFGFMTLSQYCDACAYIFVLTATSQGFILFVYYVIFNKDVRLSWMKLMKTDRKLSSSAAVTVSKTNLTNDNELDNMKQNTIENPQKILHQFSCTEDKIKKTDNSDNNFRKYINPQNQDELRKRLQTSKEIENRTDEKQNSHISNFNDYETELEKHNYYPIKTDIEGSDNFKSEIAAGEETTTKKKFNPERVGGVQPKMVMQELMKQQESINSPFSK